MFLLMSLNEIMFELFVIIRNLLVTALKLILDFLRDVENFFCFFLFCVFGLGSICSIVECFEKYA